MRAYIVVFDVHWWCIVLCAAAEKSRWHLSHPWHELLSPFPRWRPAPSRSLILFVRLAARERQRESRAQIVPQQQNLKHRDKRARTLYYEEIANNPWEREIRRGAERLLVLKVCLPLTLREHTAKAPELSLDRKEEIKWPFLSSKVLENFVASLKLAQEKFFETCEK
jgi:hypothetical protein